MPSHHDKIGLGKLVLAIGLGVMLHAFAQPVRAEVRVSGRADALTVETREASVQEVLAALRASFNLRYRITGALDRTMTGTYTGSLPRVIARLLEGHNYVLRSSAGGGELIVFGPAAAGGNGATSGRQVVADVSRQKLPGSPIAPIVPHAKSATPEPAGVQTSPGMAVIDKVKPPLVGRETGSDKTTQTPAAPANVTPGTAMTPVPVTMAARDVPAISAVNTPQMPPPVPNFEFGFGPPIISHTSDFPIAQPVPAGTVGP